MPAFFPESFVEKIGPFPVFLRNVRKMAILEAIRPSHKSDPLFHPKHTQIDLLSQFTSSEDKEVTPHHPTCLANASVHKLVSLLGM